MLTKTPDYIISEIGYPQWNKNQKPTSFADYNIKQKSKDVMQSKSTNKLLPLRETLTEYYIRLIDNSRTTSDGRSKQLTPAAITIATCYNETINPAHQKKLQKNQNNEKLKQQQQQQKYEATTIDQNTSTNHRNRGTSMGDSRKYCSAIDSDLDVF